jgi:hypothetical protein
MSHKIAIITTKDFYSNDDYDDFSIKIISSITDWQEVSDEDFRDLKAASCIMGFRVLERPVDIEKFVPKTIEDYKKLVKAEAEKQAKEKKAREDAALARKMKKELKDKASKLKMLQKLHQELGDEALTVLAKPV